MRCPVRAVSAATALAEDGYRLFQEISPHPVAIHPLAQTLDAVTDAAILSTLRADQDQELALHTSIAALHCAGYPVQWRRWYADGALVDVPATTWERHHHMIELNGGPAPTKSVRSIRTSAPSEAVVSDDVLTKLRATALTAARHSLLEHHVTDQLRTLLRLRSRHIAPHSAFSDLGLDSLRAVELRGQLQRALQIPITVAALWSHPTIQSFSAHLDALLDTSVSPEPQEA